MSDKEKQEDAEFSLPDGVSGFYTTPDGTTVYHIDPFLRNMRWKGKNVNSAHFKQLAVYERFYQQSLAFLKASSALCEKVANEETDIEWSNANVCYYCLHLATELFLKACLSRLNQKMATHEVADLRKVYHQMLPGEEFFFHTIWKFSASDLKKIAGGEVLKGVDRKPDQLYRYGMDKEDNPSQGIQCFTPGYFFNYVQYLHKRWTEIWKTLSTK